MKVIECKVQRIVEERYRLPLTDDIISYIKFDINSLLDKDYYPVEITRDMIVDTISGTIDEIEWNRKLIYDNGYESTLLEELTRELYYLVREWGSYICIDDYEDYSKSIIFEEPDEPEENFPKNLESEAE